MNYSIYIFGELSSGYTQYPEDSSSQVLKTLYKHCKAPTQIVIHRDGSLMHYCYIRKLDNDKYLGFCIAVNGYYLSKIDVLFSLFENTIEKVVSQGVIIHFTENGTLTTNISTLRSEVEELESLTESLRNEFEGFRKISKLLPQTDYSISKDSIKEHCISDGVQDIVRASYSYGFTYIYKDEDYDTVRMNSYKGVLSRLNEENTSLKKKNQELQEENTKILRQKKQFSKVIFLIIIVLGCGFGLFFLNGSLNDTRYELSKARNEINKLNSKINILNNEVKNTKKSLHTTKEERDEIQQQLNNLKEKVRYLTPILITDIQIANSNQNGEIETDYGYTIYSNNTMYLKPKITYIGIRTGENIDLDVKLFTPYGMSTGSTSPNGCSYSTSIYVYSGENTETLSGWGGSSRGHWARGEYRFEIWYNNVCLRSKIFTIY